MFFLIWIGFCAIPAIIATNKGRSAAGWFFGSLFISPLLGAIIVACLPTIRQTQEQGILATGEMRKCPHCAELVKAEAKICRYCQRDLPEAEVATAGEGSEPVSRHRPPWPGGVPRDTGPGGRFTLMEDQKIALDLYIVADI